ncbi:DUF4387 domain-containing protein [Feifania hominis]|uniref:DUF4387 domain-containing protein n=1 Tax=Feifania hominis TaxID=2763660 RepID=A0A926DDQ1_9FIRM|nr:DUF4387 domain-containing protein [Feifania hominis]MBC8535957.1 DUF4387 domain-containing protein [Feifania hominis]
MKHYRLIDEALVIRSKNSGPYELTLDIIFKEWEMFRSVCAAGVINEALVCKLYGITPDKVINIIQFEPAKAIKITIERPIASGALGETDVYGAQQHAPLLKIEYDLDD